MVEKYPEAAGYLQTNIYPDRERWAWAWVGSRFLAGVRTTGRVEVEQRIYKQMGLGMRTSLNEVFDKLNARSMEQKDQEFMQRYKVLFQEFVTDRGRQNKVPIFKRARANISTYIAGMPTFPYLLWIQHII